MKHANDFSGATKYNLTKDKDHQIKKTMAEGSILKCLVVFAIPVFISILCQLLYSAVDGWVAGNYISADALGAIGNNNQIVGIIVNLFMGITAGAGVVVARYFGAKDSENVSSSVHTAMILSVIIGAIIMFIGLSISGILLELIHTPDDMYVLSKEYLDIYFYGMIGAMIYNMGSGIIRATGDSVRPLVYLIFCSLVNLVLDLVFVIVLDWGVAGTAWATFICQMLSAAIVLFRMFFGKTVYKLSIKKMFIRKEPLKMILAIGLPAGLQTSMFSVGNLIMQSNLNTFGNAVISGYSAASKVDSFAYSPVSAMEVSINTFISQNIGARKWDRVKKAPNIALLVSFSLCLVISTVLTLLRNYVIAFFNDDPAVIEAGAYAMTWILPFYPTFVFSTIFAGTLKGAGKTSSNAIISLCSILGVRLFWLYVVLPANNTLQTLLLVYAVSWTLSSIAYTVYYYASGWRKKLMKKYPPIDETQEAVVACEK